MPGAGSFALGSIPAARVITKAPHDISWPPRRRRDISWPGPAGASWLVSLTVAASAATALAWGLLFCPHMTGANSYSVDVGAASTPPMLPDAATATRCACGHDLNHQEVLPEPVYAGWAWLLFLIGVTAMPLKVLYRCWRCRQVLKVTRDPNVLATFD